MMYHYNTDPDNIILLGNLWKRYNAQEIRPKLVNAIHLKWTFEQDKYNDEVFPQDQFLDQQIKKYKSELKDIQNVTEIILEFDLSWCEEDSIWSKFKSFILNDLVRRFRETIIKLSVYKCHLQYLVNEESEVDQIEELLNSLITTPKNLMFLSLVDRLNTRDVSQDSVCSRLLKFINNKSSIFNNIESYELGLCHHFEGVQTKKQSPQIVNFIYSFAESFQQLPKLSYLKLILNHLELDVAQFQKINDFILKCKNLKKLSLDYTQDNSNHLNTVETFKTYQKFNNQLQGLELIESPFFKQSLLGSFISQLSKYNHLESLSLNKLKLEQGGTTELFSCLKSFTSLKYLDLDMKEYKIKGNEIQTAFKHFNPITFNLKSLNLQLPLVFKPNLDQFAPIILFIENQQETLEDLRLSFKNNLQYQAFIEIMETFGKLSKLENLELYFLKNEKVDNKIVISSKGIKGVQDIFSFKKLYFSDFDYDRHYYSLNRLAFSYLVKYQKIGIEDFDCQLADEYYTKEAASQEYQDLFRKNLSTCNFKTVKTITTEFYNKWIGLSLLSICKENLQNLKLTHPLDDTQLGEILKCSNLISLHTQYNPNNNTITIKEILKSLNSLQIIHLFVNYTNYNGKKVDCSDLISSQYVTEVSFQNIITEKNQFLKLIPERKVQILQLLAYQKFIQPQILYMTNQSHWDIYY